MNDTRAIACRKTGARRLYISLYISHRTADIRRHGTQVAPDRCCDAGTTHLGYRTAPAVSTLALHSAPWCCWGARRPPPLGPPGLVHTCLECGGPGRGGGTPAGRRRATSARVSAHVHLGAVARLELSALEQSVDPQLGVHVSIIVSVHMFFDNDMTYIYTYACTTRTSCMRNRIRKLLRNEIASAYDASGTRAG